MRCAGSISRCAPGRFTVVVGPNGAGKTTLLRSLAGLLSPAEAGDAERRDLAHLGGRERARPSRIWPQNGAVAWPIPVESVVALGRLPHRRGARRAVAAGPRSGSWCHRGSGLRGFEARAATELSGGERARVLLARALATQAPVLLSTSPWRRSIRATSWSCSRS